MEKNDIKKYLFIAIILVIILILLGNMIKNADVIKRYKEYKSETYAQDFISSAHKIEDRNTYYILEKIIIDYIASYSPHSEFDAGFRYEEYYSCLSDYYKKYLKYDKYLDVAEDFLQGFYVTQNVTSNSQLVFRELIKEIHVNNENMYMCVLRNDNLNKNKYIGIELHEESKEFRIFYIG